MGFPEALLTPKCYPVLMLSKSNQRIMTNVPIKTYSTYPKALTGTYLIIIKDICRTFKWRLQILTANLYLGITTSSRSPSEPFSPWRKIIFCFLFFHKFAELKKDQCLTFFWGKFLCRIYFIRIKGSPNYV